MIETLYLSIFKLLVSFLIYPSIHQPTHPTCHLYLSLFVIPEQSMWLVLLWVIPQLRNTFSLSHCGVWLTVLNRVYRKKPHCDNLFICWALPVSPVIDGRHLLSFSGTVVISLGTILCVCAWLFYWLLSGTSTQQIYFFQIAQSYKVCVNVFEWSSVIGQIVRLNDSMTHCIRNCILPECILHLIYSMHLCSMNPL